jgi:PhoD-like phosphatase, N-terminal domain
MLRPSHERTHGLLPPASLPLAEDPFTLGVAAGEPTEQGALLWTRLAPRPELVSGGMPLRPEALRWEVASDDGFRRIVARGTAVAVPAHAHSVHVRVDGLAPAGIYWFRFRCGRFLSPSGLLRTLPSLRCHVESVQLAIPGALTAAPDGARADLAAVARDDLELVVLVHAAPEAPECSMASSADTALDELRRRHAAALQRQELRLLRQRVMTLPVYTGLDSALGHCWYAAAQAFWEHNAVSHAAAARGAQLTWGRLVEMQLGRGGRAGASKRAAWTITVRDERVRITSRHGGLLRSDVAPIEALAHLAARPLSGARGSYLRCELTQEWARWEHAPVPALRT